MALARPSLSFRCGAGFVKAGRAAIRRREKMNIMGSPSPSVPGAAKGRRLTIVASSNFLRGYGGIAYLAEAICARGISVRVIAPIPVAELPGARRFAFSTRSLYSIAPWSAYLSRRLFHLELALTGALTARHWLFTDLSFYREAVMIRRLRPGSRLIHYCAELLTPEEFPGVPGTAFYAAHAGVPDLVIDVNEERAARRRDRFGLSSGILVLPNTLPHSEVPPPAPRGTLARLAGGDLPEGVPVLLYPGGTHAGTGLETLVAAVAGLERPAVLLVFCNSDQPDELRRVQGLVNDRLGPARGRVCAPVPRQQLLASMWEALLGFVSYPYSAAPSWNQLYCAPTKAFECIATGLPIVASANPPLQALVAARNVGVCARDDSVEALREATSCLLHDSGRRLEMSERGKRLFAEELCFERVSAPIVNRILDVTGTADR